VGTDTKKRGDAMTAKPRPYAGRLLARREVLTKGAAVLAALTAAGAAAMPARAENEDGNPVRAAIEQLKQAVRAFRQAAEASLEARLLSLEALNNIIDSLIDLVTFLALLIAREQKEKAIPRELERALDAVIESLKEFRRRGREVLREQQGGGAGGGGTGGVG
jgi:hypothetical protein